MPKTKPSPVAKSPTATLRRIARSNPQVNTQLVEESIAFVTFARAMGLKGRGYNILRSSESHLKMKSPILARL